METHQRWNFVEGWAFHNFQEIDAFGGSLIGYGWLHVGWSVENGRSVSQGWQ